MKKLLFISALLIFISPVFAKNISTDTSKCTDLIAELRKSREAISNVLNLTEDQRRCKKTIDEKFEIEFAGSCEWKKRLKI